MPDPSLPGNLRGLIVGILTIGLLGLYAWLVFDIICNALAASHDNSYTEPTERVSYLITTLQSLVSALVLNDAWRRSSRHLSIWVAPGSASPSQPRTLIWE